MLFNYYGDGKGKSTVSLGLLIRAFSAGKKVFLIHFDKYGANISEHTALDKLNIPHYIYGCNRVENGKFRFGYEDRDIEEIKKGVDKIIEVYDQYDFIVLDEFNIVWEAIKKLDYQYDKILKVLEFFRENEEKDLVISGMIKNSDLIEMSDLVSEIKKIKHYFDKGVNSREGIEY